MPSRVMLALIAGSVTRCDAFYATPPYPRASSHIRSSSLACKQQELDNVLPRRKEHEEQHHVRDTLPAITVTSSIPGATAPWLAELITKTLKAVDAPHWLQEVNYAHLTNAALNLCVLVYLSSYVHQEGDLTSFAVLTGSFGLISNLIGLVYDNLTVAFGRNLWRTSDDTKKLLRQLSKGRLILHSWCVALIIMPIAVVGWQNGIIEEAPVNFGLLCAAAYADSKLVKWSKYDHRELAPVHDEAEAAHNRGAYSFTSGKVLELVLPCIAATLFMLGIGGRLIQEGSVPLGSLLVIGSLTMLGITSASKAQAFHAWGETFMLATLAIAFSIGGLHPLDVTDHGIIDALLRIR